MKKHNIDTSAMNISFQEKEWGYSIVFSDNILCSKEVSGSYSQYFPPFEKKLSEKIAAINFLKLKEKQGLNILDIGTGCGHFPTICNRLGHKATGTEIKESLNELTDLYRLYNLTVTELFIEKQKYIKFDQKYNLITMLRTVFDTSWGRDDWIFLKNNLFDYLEPGGEIFIKTNIKSLPFIKFPIEEAFGNRLPGWNSLTFHIKKEQ